jgi:hypothetical protein
MSQTLMLGLCSAVVLLATPNDSIKSGVPWFDTDGNLIDAHGAGLLEHEGRFYWYGSVRSMNSTGNDHNGGISLYSSADLYNVSLQLVLVSIFLMPLVVEVRECGAASLQLLKPRHRLQ